MSARLPRKVFATPFVVTLAACGGGATGDAPQPPVTPTIEATPTNPPAPDEHVLMPTAQPTDVPSAAPSAVAPAAKDQSWTITKKGKECTTLAAVDCSQPPGEPQHTCNPPPAMKYACPEGVDVPDGSTVVRPAGKAECELRRPTQYPDMSAMHCPKGARCNPPPPQHFEPVPVACPKP